MGRLARHERPLASRHTRLIFRGVESHVFPSLFPSRDPHLAPPALALRQFPRLDQMMSGMPFWAG